MSNFENNVICTKNLDPVDQKLENQYDDCSSDDEEEILKNNLIQQKLNRVSNNVEISKLRSLPTTLFYVFLLCFSMVTAKYVSGYYSVNKFTIYNDKFKINYISEAFHSQNDFIKVNKCVN